MTNNAMMRPTPLNVSTNGGTKWLFSVVTAVFVLLLLTAQSTTSAAAASSKNVYVGGKPHGKPIDLGPESFPLAMEDTANPFWFLKFYAPWCGHCKKMAPMLEKVAIQLQGKMAIGKIDCTQYKELCNTHKVRGFPTLKYSIDGQIMDYPGGRDAPAITAFAHKMAAPAVTVIKRLDEATRFSQRETEEGVCFLGTDKTMEGSKLYEIFSTVARRQQASAYFLWLEQDPRDLEDGKDSAFVHRIETGVVEPRQWSMDELSVEALEKWIRDQNVPTLVTLGPHNYARISKSGRPLAMTVLDLSNEELVEATKKHMIDFILKAPPPEVEKYYYGLFDGKKWFKFLEQFHVKQEDSPQFLILDAPTKQYWRNETYTKFLDFMMAVSDGTIPAKMADKTGYGDTTFGWIIELFYDYMPYSLAPIFIVLCLVVVMIATPAKEDFRPKYRPAAENEQQEGDHDDDGKGEDDAVEGEDEPKKDK